MKKLVFILLFTCSINILAQEEEIKFGLSLCGGGALGLAHIGVLEVIDSLDIPINYVAGTSMGGLVGGLYSMGYSVDEMKELVVSINWPAIFNDKPSREFLPYLIKKNSGRYQLEFEMDGFTPKMPSGIIKGQNISLLFSELTYPFEDLDHFDHLPIPFRCVAVDLVSGDEIVFEDGSLAIALRATMSIPSAFAPIKLGDSTLVIDGGVVNNFPVDVVKKMGADKVIGLNITFASKSIDYYDNMLNILNRTSDLPRYRRLNNNIKNSEYYIDEYLEGFSIVDFDSEKIPLIIAQGKKAAYEHLDQLLEIKEIVKKQKSNSKLPIVNNIKTKGNYYLTALQLKRIFGVYENQPFDKKLTDKKINSYFNTTLIDSLSYNIKRTNNNKLDIELVVSENLEPTIEEIRVIGLKRVERSLILNNLRITEEGKFNLSILKKDIKHLYGLGYFNTIRYEINRSEFGKVIVNLNIEEKSFQKFVTGFRYDDYFKLIGLVGFQSNSLLLKGMHFDTELQFSGLTKFNATVLYPSTSFDLPLYPFIYTEYQKIPRDIYNLEGNKAINFDEKSWKFGAGIGIGLWNFLNLEARLQTELPDIKIVFQGGTESTNTTIIDQQIVASNFRIDLDLIDDVLTPNSGVRFYAEGEVAVKSLGSDYYYERIEAFLDLYKTYGLRHTIRIKGDYKRAWHTDPFYKTLFFVGGPESFVGINYFQALGSMFNIVRAEYRYQLGKGLFLKGIVNSTIGYKLGTSSMESTGKELFGWGVGLKYTSILGPIEIIFAHGDSNVYDVGEKEGLIYFVMGYKF